MSELSIIIRTALICIAVVSSIYFVYKIIATGKQANVKADLKNKVIEFGNMSSQTNIIDNSFNKDKEINKLRDKNNNEILDFYKKKQYDDDITRLTIYIEYSKIISRTIIDVFSIVISYIAKNHILSKDKSEFDLYVKEKRLLIIEMFDKSLSNSSIDCIKKLSINKVCNFYYMIVLDLIKDMYCSIYENHKIQAEKKKEFFSNLKNIAKEDRFKSYDVFIRNNHTETNIKDAGIVKDSMEYLLNFLLGLFHDMIEREYYNEKYK